ncbi:hypothetical protein C1922_17650 [Stenotrophomonas sp. ZAC14D2_NAIMI4_7]|uniref:hypothetical protein n=1 Tax=Stenotrophomonas sp. ZAC14D2_NAIMI4_7 TaxID=2072405 RepID=UPI000D53C7DC|nr:hypothetical protein [Stenotrophomonas sp. ZAC14D2_NAIMI4_7]AWH19002.1 hypothetical protein C1922_17650 [Stenotrophomonas sp. ZAC14D2_NAIMI4_7]
MSTDKQKPGPGRRYSLLEQEMRNYRYVSRFISYRRYYAWRAKFHYYWRYVNKTTLLIAFMGLCLATMCWVQWRALNPTVPRIHPQAAQVRMEALSFEAYRRMGAVRYADGRGLTPFTTHARIVAGAERAIRVRQALQVPAALQLQSDMLADIADYIGMTGVCAPYPCEVVREYVQTLHEAGERSLQVQQALQPVLELPEHVVPALEGERARLAHGWADSFDDVDAHLWILHDLRRMHGNMMLQARAREPWPLLARVVLRDQQPPSRW